MGGSNTASLVDTSSKMANLRTGRQLAMEITKSGADLYDLLDKEPDLRVKFVFCQTYTFSYKCIGYSSAIGSKAAGNE